MLLVLHLFIHFFLAVLVGCYFGLRFKHLWLGIILGIVGGVLIDFDHVLEYFFFYGWHFNFVYFIESRQFLLTDKVRIFFHAWEYFPLLLLIAYLVRKKQILKMIFLTLAFAGLVHLITDVCINGYRFQYYSLTYRALHHFSAPELLSPADYQFNQTYKRRLGI
ncbi:MAG TPA: hypothetical protein VFD16_02990 [Candidatus Saccharimonadales bacterium]|nr:hypothetical protein [Candidatus Saccharimonadales bacterium]